MEKRRNVIVSIIIANAILMFLSRYIGLLVFLVNISIYLLISESKIIIVITIIGYVLYILEGKKHPKVNKGLEYNRNLKILYDKLQMEYHRVSKELKENLDKLKVLEGKHPRDLKIRMNQMYDEYNNMLLELFTSLGTLNKLVKDLLTMKRKNDAIEKDLQLKTEEKGSLELKLIENNEKIEALKNEISENEENIQIIINNTSILEEELKVKDIKCHEYYNQLRNVSHEMNKEIIEHSRIAVSHELSENHNKELMEQVDSLIHQTEYFKKKLEDEDTIKTLKNKIEIDTEKLVRLNEQLEEIEPQSREVISLKAEIDKLTDEKKKESDKTLVEKIADLEKDANRYKTQIESLNIALDEYKEKNKILDDKILEKENKYQDANIRINRLKTNITSLKKQIEMYNHYITELTTQLQAKEKLESITKEYEDSKRQYELCAKDLWECKAHKNKLEDEIEDMRKSKDQLMYKIDEQSKYIEKLKEYSEGCDSEIYNLQLKIKGYSKLEEKCKELENIINLKDEDIEEREKKIHELSNINWDLTHNTQQLEELKIDIDKLRDEYDYNRNDLEDILSLLKQKHEELFDEIINIKDVDDIIKMELVHIGTLEDERIEEISKLHNSIDMLLPMGIVKLDYNSMMYVKESLNKLSDISVNFTESLNRLSDIISDNEVDEQLSDKITKYHICSKSIGDIMRILQTMDILEQILDVEFSGTKIYENEELDNIIDIPKEEEEEWDEWDY